MSFCQTASLVETGPITNGDGRRSGNRVGAGVPSLRGLSDALVGLVHVFDVSLEKQKIGRRLAVDL